MPLQKYMPLVNKYMGNNIIASIRYAIDEYEYDFHETPDKILVNYALIVALKTEIQCHMDEKATICGIPISLALIEDDTPRFWLCKEGKIYD